VSGFELPWRLFVPPTYDENRKYPLVLFLHSGDARGDDNVRHLTEDVGEWTSRAQRVEPALVLAPHCPGGRKWADTGGRPFRNYDQRQVKENEVGRAVRKALEDVRGQYSIDPERLYISGASMGGTGTWDLITRHPGSFAAAVPCTGVSDPRRAEVIVELPIWAFHGALDNANSVENTRAMVSALRSLGSGVRYTEYADVAHNSWARAYAMDELYRWLFVQRAHRRDPLGQRRK